MHRTEPCPARLRSTPAGRGPEASTSQRGVRGWALLSALGIAAMLAGLGVCVISLVAWVDREVIELPGEIGSRAAQEAPSPGWAGPAIGLGLMLAGVFLAALGTRQTEDGNSRESP